MTDPGVGGRTVVISGASSGIGLATAAAFAAAGDHVINLDVASPPPEAPCRWIQVDVTDRGALGAVIDELAQAAPLDVVIANAGMSIRRPFLDMQEDDVRRLLDLNVLGVLWLWQAAARHMVRATGGVLLATASTNGSVGYPFYADYNASKSAVLSLTRTVALELAPLVRTACVSPGYVLTPMQRAEYDEPMLAEVNKRIPAGRHADPAEIAEAFRFLASPQARYITGQQLVVDGGETAGGTASAFRTHLSSTRAPDDDPVGG